MNFLKNKKGQALIEFAIILPIIILILMGIMEFGVMLNSYLKIENASREAARAGIVGASDVEIEALVTQVSPSLDSNNLQVTISPAEAYRVSGGTLTVTVTYNYPMITPIISNLFGGTISLNADTSMRIE